MIILDTHIILWNALSPEKLSQKAQQAIAQANESKGMVFCGISLWEIAMLLGKRRIHLDTSYQNFIQLLMQSNRYQIQEITPEIAELSTQLGSEVNKDPADRIIAATATIRQSPLVTADRNLLQADCIPTLW